MDHDDLRQADLSHLRLNDMTVEQRAEMRRRYLEFVQHHAKKVAAPPRRAAKPARWMPGRAAR
jgi:hypothetical protein